MGPDGQLALSNVGQLQLLRAFEERGAGLRTTVRGASMSPFLRDRDVVTLAPLNGREPRVGDIVAAALGQPERLVIHRVVARRPGGWLIRGDACPHADGVVTGSAVLGRVQRVERGGRRVRAGAEAGLFGGAMVAVLSRRSVLARAVGLWRHARGAVSAAARRLQSWRPYRVVGRRHAPRVTVTEASDGVGDAVPRGEGVGATEWVAHLGVLRAGSAQLVTIADMSNPWAGHWLHSLSVRVPLRGIGIGETLVGAVVDGARRDGAAQLLLAVQEDNARAIGLYRKLGFEHVVLPALEPTLCDERRRIGRRRVVMRLPLAAAS